MRGDRVAMLGTGGSAAMTFNLSELFERIAHAVGDRDALVETRRRVTYRQLDERASRLADHLACSGVGPGDHVGLHLLNGSEYLEGMLAAFKLRAVPININYRYVERELEYLYGNADLVAVVFNRQFGPRVAAAAASVPNLRTFLVVEDPVEPDGPLDGEGLPPATTDYEEALAAADPAREFPGRSGDDIYIAYTGGTTGLPKGVMWRHEDIFFAALGGGDPTTLEGPIAEPDEIVGRIPANPIVNLYTPPFMHVSAHWGAFQVLYGGGVVVVPRPGSFDPDEVWSLVDRERVNVVTVVGDAMMRPLLAAYQRGGYDGSSLFVLASGGAPLSESAKDLAHDLLPHVIVVDGYGSTELGVTATSARMPGAGEPERTRFRIDERTAVLDENLDPLEPGSEVIGSLARTGRIPLGYYKDPEKTSATIVEKDGRRWVLSGDFASVEADGRITLHGRGSVSINTGGEKVFPEEVEKVLVSHPAVRDAVVVGVPDEVWGNRVTAVVAFEVGQQIGLDALQEHCRGGLAGYKIPRELVVVDDVLRNPNGKADYSWARARALEAVAS
jgi:acyl-CoA synthetase (AMP-forming)/AMP-acid ligase II